MKARTIEWLPDREGSIVPGRVRLLDQTRLPEAVTFVETDDVKEIWAAIRTLQVRGAPAIGVAAAFGVVAAVQRGIFHSGAEFKEAVDAAAVYLASSRPTAVNLFWALDRMKRAAAGALDLPADAAKERLAAEALAIWKEDIETCRAIGRFGVQLLDGVDAVLTHCNAGRLATSEYGTALAPIYVAHESGRKIGVYSDETRPLLQGSRLTAWELQEAGIEVTVICDNMAATVMRQGRVQAVLVGADRIAANGDTANKIGTYGVALLAKAHAIPFYVLAPTSTFDMSLPTGDQIPIEERSPEEITRGFGKLTAPAGVRVYSPAFDVTPAALIAAIVCEKGIARPDFTKSLREMMAKRGPGSA